jgi:signal transduction histidine kinase
MEALELLVLERLPDGRFQRCNPCPRWCAALGLDALAADDPFSLDDVFPFLGVFLPDAEACWSDGRAARVDSGFWTEKAATGEIHLDAAAVLVDARPILVVSRDERMFAQQELLLQRARELRLTHGSLVREIEHKDILVHAIVHDLAAPLHGILGALSLLSELQLDEQATRWTQIALQAALRQRQLIGDILDVFSADYGVLTSAPDPALAPDLGQAIAAVVAQAAPAAHTHGATLAVALPPGSKLHVVAEETRLVRVLANLVENALRHSPAGGCITISAARRDRTVHVSVDDQGPGVSAETLPHLFERFAGGAHVSGTGLGLYFCRITVERWGGGIGYERREPVGSRFWIRLVHADAGDDDGQADDSR